MQRFSQVLARRAAAALLVVLLLVPLAFRGHGHGNHATTGRACATCVAVHHSPALSAPAAATHGPLFHAIGVVVARLIPAARSACPARAGRAPPAAPAPIV